MAVSLKDGYFYVNYYIWKEGYILSNLPPCKTNGTDCANRCVGCHSSCEAYQRFIQKKKELKETIEKQKDKELYFSTKKLAASEKKHKRRQKDKMYVKNRFN